MRSLVSMALSPEPCMDNAARRFAVALLGIAVSIILFHTQLAGALIVRGDEMLVRNSYDGASNRYRRALWLDSSSSIAADRFIFVSLQRRTPQALRSAVGVASAYLAKRHDDPTVLFDRGMCQLLLKRYRAALLDFDRAARLTRDPQEYAFAGWAAKRSGKLSQAVKLWNAALRLRPGYRPAMAALAEFKR